MGAWKSLRKIRLSLSGEDAVAEDQPVEVLPEVDGPALSGAEIVTKKSGHMLMSCTNPTACFPTLQWRLWAVIL
jgi:hypothetical protein